MAPYFPNPESLGESEQVTLIPNQNEDLSVSILDLHENVDLTSAYYRMRPPVLRYPLCIQQDIFRVVLEVVSSFLFRTPSNGC